MSTPIALKWSTKSLGWPWSCIWSIINKTFEISYGDVRKNVARFEKYMIVLLVSVHVILFLVLILVIIFQFTFGCESILRDEKYTDKELIWQVSHIMQSILYHWKSVLNISFAISKFVLYIILTKTLKSSLHFYYQKNWHNITVLTIVSIMYLLASGIIGVLEFSFDIDTINIIKTRKTYPIGLRIFYLIFTVSIFWLFIFYIIYNVKNIYFKRYLQDILKGYKLDRHMGKASKFVKQSRLPKMKKQCMQSSVNNDSDLYESLEQTPIDKAVGYNMAQTENMCKTHGYKDKFTKTKVSEESYNQNFGY